MVSFRARFDALAAAVFESGGGFEEEKTFFRCGGEDATATGVFHDFIVVGFWIVAEDGEFEAVLAFGFGVATAGHTAGFGHHGKDIANEGWDVSGCSGGIFGQESVLRFAVAIQDENFSFGGSGGDAGAVLGNGDAVEWLTGALQYAFV